MARLRQRAPLPEPSEKVAAVDAMFDTIAPRYDRLNRILTLGLDVAWRRTAVRALGLDAKSRPRVLDIACGTGDFCREIANASGLAIGLDRSSGMLTAAAAAGTRAPLVRGDGLSLPVRDGSFDGITCGFALRNVVALDPLFAECARALRPGGRVAFLEVAEPEWALARTGHRVYFRHVVPFVGGLLSDRAAYRYLPDSTAYLPSPDELTARLAAAGFANVNRRLLGLGAAQLLCATAR
ncbi:MAG: demethylmenaquinone methyltransferase / 2-methoxy-6-polyprenyl,4-benzoquinol methylase [Actinomycetota bacterium]|nr:demethylmenaquinone methyltransferase / 2-methoxy-6-polyprenyl,4-benzoquinol methylase [Actinomycetota bacterium]